MNERVTIREVAAEAKVSIATVSKALNGSDVVAPKTKVKVLEAAKRLRYVPNLLGKQLKTKTTKMIGFYTHTIIGPYFSTLIESIVEEADKHQYGVYVIISSDKQVLSSHLFGHMVDGFIGFEELIDEESLQMIRSEKIHAVFMDRKISDSSISSVVFDSKRAGALATQYLIEKGHRKIGFLLGHEGVYDSEDRFQGFKDTMKKEQLLVNKEWVLSGLFEERASYKQMHSFLTTKDPSIWPTAWLAGNDLSAIGIIKAIEDLHLSVPKDFSVIGFDDIELLRYFKPNITTIKNPIREQGRQAVMELLSLIKKETIGKEIVLKGELKIRDTTRHVENEQLLVPTLKQKEVQQILN